VTPPGDGRDSIYVEPFPPTGEKHQITPAANDGHFPVWNGNGELLWIDASRTVNGRVGLVSAKVTTQPHFEVAREWQQIDRKFIVTAGAIGRARTFDILPDGQRFIAVPDEGRLTREPQSSRLQVVINWFEELKRQDSGN
jgi:hypothetical protein